MLLAMAWRNLWRNTRRTIITVMALTLGVAAVVTIHSYRESVFKQMIHEITVGLIGHAQVHAKGYQADPEIGRVVVDPLTVEARLRTALPGAALERRVMGYGLAGVGEASSAALVLGIEPALTPGVRPLVTITRGRALGAHAAQEAVLGRELAVQLDAVPGASLVLVGQAADGSVANDRYIVVGIGDAGSAELNGNAVFLNLTDAQDFFALGAGAHQIIVRLPTSDEDLSTPLATVRAALDLATLEVLAWSEILPELQATMAEKRRYQRVLDLVVILIVGLGVLNAMTMSTFERTREFGVLASLGTRRRRIVGLVVIEALLQGALGCVAGVLLALGLLYALGSLRLGGLSEQDMLGVQLPAVVDVALHPAALVNAVVTALATVLAGGLWPAIRAARHAPAEATRYV